MEIEEVEIKCSECSRILAKFRGYESDYGESISYYCEFCVIDRIRKEASKKADITKYDIIKKYAKEHNISSFELSQMKDKELDKLYKKGLFEQFGIMKGLPNFDEDGLLFFDELNNSKCWK